MQQKPLFFLLSWMVYCPLYVPDCYIILINITNILCYFPNHCFCTVLSWWAHLAALGIYYTWYAMSNLNITFWLGLFDILLIGYQDAVKRGIWKKGWISKIEWSERRCESVKKSDLKEGVNQWKWVIWKKGWISKKSDLKEGVDQSKRVIWKKGWISQKEWSERRMVSVKSSIKAT